MSLAVELRQPCSPTDVIDEAHKHQCDSCGTTWAHTDHLNAMGATREEYELAHTCPNCGEEQYYKVVDEAERRKADRGFEALLADLFGI